MPLQSPQLAELIAQICDAFVAVSDSDDSTAAKRSAERIIDCLPMAAKEQDAGETAPIRTCEPAAIVSRPWTETIEPIIKSAEALLDMHPYTTTRRPKLKKHNWDRVIIPMLTVIAQGHLGISSIQEWFEQDDILHKEGKAAFCKYARQASYAAGDVTAFAFFSQPSVLATILVMQYSYMEALQFVRIITPSCLQDADGASMVPTLQGTPRILRVPVDFLTDDESTINTAWLCFTPHTRRIPIAMTDISLRAIANDQHSFRPLGRLLGRIGLELGRRLDAQIFDHMLAISDEHNAVAVADEPVLSYQAIPYGNVTANLYPHTTFSGTGLWLNQRHVKYGANAVTLIHLHSNAAPDARWGTAPIVRPRIVSDVSATGTASHTTINPICVQSAGLTEPLIQGALDADRNIIPLQGQTEAHYAVDYENGAIILSESVPGLIESVRDGDKQIDHAFLQSLTVSYSYATNFDEYETGYDGAIGVTPSMDHNRLFDTLKATARTMSGKPYYCRPNAFIGSEQTADYLSSATRFYVQNDPDVSVRRIETDLCVVGEMAGSKIQTPWNGGDSRILVFRDNTAIYALENPVTVLGPYPAYHDGKLMAADVFYAEERSVIDKPVLTKVTGEPIHRSLRTIVLRSTKGAK